MRAAVTRVIVVGVFLGLLTPATAAAQIGKGWLERLSGPGPFRGFTIDMRLGCFSTPYTEGERVIPETEQQRIASGRKPNEVRVQRGVERRTTRDNQQVIEFVPLKDYIKEELDRLPRVARWFVGPDHGDSYGWFSLYGCNFMPSSKPRIEVGFEFSPLESGVSSLEYESTPANRDINLRIFLITADIRMNRWLDVGYGFGWGFFSPDQAGLFESFHRRMDQLLRLTTRPLAILAHSKKADALLIQFSGTRFNQGFTAADFGAIGEFNDPGEMLWELSFKADVMALIWPGPRKAAPPAPTKSQGSDAPLPAR